MRLFHFSDDPAIATFIPRPVGVAAPRAKGKEWLNGPLVWAIDENHQPMYLFPRECPRILLWPKADSLQSDRDEWWRGSRARMIAFIEAAWSKRHAAAHLYRYEFPEVGFENLHDAGMWVSRAAVKPVDVVRINGLPERLAEQGVELRILDSLAPLKNIWSTSLHASGLRLRSASGWLT
jgi:hypothetical protein